MQAEHGSPLSWLSPVAWGQQVRAFVDLRLWPLGLGVAVIGATLALGSLLRTRRDLGAGLLPARAGRADAGPRLATPFALALRNERAALAWWTVGCAAMSGLTGTVAGRGAAQALEAIAAQNELSARILRGDPLAAFLALMMLHVALAVAVFATAGVLRIRAEEDAGRLGMCLAAPVSRTRLLLSHVGVVGLGSAALLLVGATALWAGSRLAGGDVDLAGPLGGGAAYGLGIAALVAVVALALAWRPGAAGALAWGLFALVLVESLFGALRRLPGALTALSPFRWAGRYPLTPLEPAHLAGLAAGSAALLALAVVALRRRDLRAG